MGYEHKLQWKCQHFWIWKTLRFEFFCGKIPFPSVFDFHFYLQKNLSKKSHRWQFSLHVEKTLQKTLNCSEMLQKTLNHGQTQCSFESFLHQQDKRRLTMMAKMKITLQSTYCFISSVALYESETNERCFSIFFSALKTGARRENRFERFSPFRGKH